LIFLSLISTFSFSKEFARFFSLIICQIQHHQNIKNKKTVTEQKSDNKKTGTEQKGDNKKQ